MESVRRLIGKVFRLQPMKKMTMTAVVTRANGTVENLGVIASGYIEGSKVETILGGK